MWAAGKPSSCAGPPADCTNPSIRLSWSPPHKAPSWNSTDNFASSSKGTPPASPGPSSPMASKVVARNHLAGVSLQDMKAYLLHHLKIVGVKRKDQSRIIREFRQINPKSNRDEQKF
ncbi:hypothetical protein DFAR_680007 [Desulfarculales bacterium]